MRILIVDDSTPLRDLLRATIRAQPGLEVCGEASDGLEAVEKADALRPDLIVLDLSMPRMNGMEAGVILQSKFPNTWLILFTMYKNEVLVKQAGAAGFSAVLSKSDGTRSLITEIQRLANAPSKRAARDKDAETKKEKRREAASGRN
jgi:DNA-binding NarL/FixJ family response regulator